MLLHRRVLYHLKHHQHHIQLAVPQITILGRVGGMCTHVMCLIFTPKVFEEYLVKKRWLHSKRIYIKYSETQTFTSTFPLAPFKQTNDCNGKSPCFRGTTSLNGINGPCHIGFPMSIAACGQQRRHLSFFGALRWDRVLLCQMCLLSFMKSAVTGTVVVKHSHNQFRLMTCSKTCCNSPRQYIIRLFMINYSTLLSSSVELSFLVFALPGVGGPKFGCWLFYRCFYHLPLATKSILCIQSGIVQPYFSLHI